MRKSRMNKYRATDKFKLAQKNVKKHNSIKDLCNEFQHNTNLEVGAASIQGSRGGDNEDTHIIIEDQVKGLGKVEVFGVFDGHTGKQVSNWLKDNTWKYLKEELENRKLNNKGICKAFKNAQIKWQLLCPHVSGTTVILSLKVIKTNRVYNLSIGDGRFNYISKVTGETINTNMTCIDFVDNSRKEYVGPAINTIHQVNGRVVHTASGKIYGDDKKIKKTPEVYHEYHIENDIDRQYWDEWVKWNKYNNNKYLTFITFCAGAYRIGGGLQPTRTIGREDSLHLGCLYIFDILPQETIATYSCDGVDDNQATNQEFFGKLITDYKESNRRFYDNHKGINLILKNNLSYYKTRPADEDTLKSKVQWLTDAFKYRNPLWRLDDDWKRGVRDANKFLQEYKFGDDCQSVAEYIAYYCSARMSGDNVTVIIAKWS